MMQSDVHLTDNVRVGDLSEDIPIQKAMFLGQFVGLGSFQKILQVSLGIPCVRSNGRKVEGISLS